MMLKEVCSIKMGQSPASDSYNDNGEGVPFFQGNADFGERYPVARKWCSAPMKMAEPEDILISVRAPIGALNYAKEECCIGRGLAALTPNKSKILPEYMFWLLKGKNAELNSKGTGSTFKAIGRKVLEEILVPDIGMEQQMEYAANLEKINGIIQLRKQELQKLDELIKSRFVEMFGNPVSNPKGMVKKTLPELGEFGRGVSKHRPRNDKALLGGPYPLIQTGDIANSGMYITEYHSTYSELGLRQSKMWDKGTLCITIAANIAKTAILGFDACFPDSVVGFNANENTNNVFVHYWFSFFQEILESQAPESAQKNINLKILSKLEVIVPGIQEQNKFAAFVAQTDKSKLTIQKSLDELETLNKALMQKYFGGNGV